MIFDKTVYRGGYHCSEADAAGLAHLAQNFSVGIAETADDSYRNILLVLEEGSVYEIAEIALHKLSGRGAAPVDILDYGEVGGVIFGGEILRDSLRDQILDEVREKELAEGRSAAFIP